MNTTLSDKPAALKKSYYNFYIHKENGAYIAFNSATGAIVRVFNQDHVARLENMIKTENDIMYDENDEMVSVFYEKGFLVNRDKDEYQFIRYAYERDVVRNRSLALTLITTRQCNLRCVYCYEKHENKAMSNELYDSIVDYIKNSLKNKLYTSVYIGLFGGEPFVEYSKVIVFLEKVKAVCEEHEVPFNSSATTNGALIYPERFERLISAGCDKYQITVDGFADTHDKYRVSATGSGSYEMIMNNLKYMQSTDHQFNVTIRTNFNEEVFKRAVEFYTYIKDTFDERFNVYYEGIKHLGGEEDDKVDILQKEDVVKSSIKIAQEISNMSINSGVTDYMTRPYSRVCYASKHNNFLIDYDGSVLKCTLSLDDDLNKIGYIKDGEMIINPEKHSKWVGMKIDLIEGCKNCKVLPICFGGRCIWGRVQGDQFYCDPRKEEEALENLVGTMA